MYDFTFQIPISLVYLRMEEFINQECFKCKKVFLRSEDKRTGIVCKNCYPAYKKSINIFHMAKRRAQDKNLPFELDVDWIFNKILKGHCEVTGLPFKLSHTGTNYRDRHTLTPSLDRIIPSKGYLKSNCRLVIWWYNMAKHTHTDLDTWHLCNAVANCSLEKLVPSVREKAMTNMETT